MTSVDPRQGPVVGGTEVEVRGAGFVEPTSGFLGNVLIDRVVVHGPDRITFVTPPADIPGPVDLQLQNANGLVVVGAAFHYYRDLMVSSAEPRAGPTTGGVAVVLHGAGFGDGVLVTVGGRLAVDPTPVDDETLFFYLPPGESGVVDLQVFAPDGRFAVLPDGFEYYEPVDLRLVSPAGGPTAGGTEITLEGTGLVEGTMVTVGPEQAEVLSYGPTGHSIVALTPPMPPGPQPVSVFNDNGDSTLRGGFTYFEAGTEDLELSNVTPDHGSSAGGDLVTLVGTGFGPDSRVTFGGEEAGCILEGPNTLRCRTPAHQEGSVPVSVSSGGHVSTVPDGFTFLPPLRVTGITPARGPSGGGTRVTIRGEGFGQGTSVVLGVLPLEGMEVRDSHTIEGATPPGSPGPADLVVTRGETSVTAAAAFEYTDRLRILTVDPPRGSIAGGTIVTITGTGFERGASVLVGMTLALDVEVPNGSTLRFTTPPGDEGPVDLTVTLPDGTTLVQEGGFEYFDPTTLYGGLWGDPVDGTINISVRDAMAMDHPIEGAFTILWTDRDTRYQGLTDERGLITFSGPDLRGRQMITVAKEGYENTSVVMFDAQNVTVALVPKPDPQPPPPGEEIQWPVVSGVVWGLNKYLPEPEEEGLDKVALVFTTHSDMLTDYRPPPGPGAILHEDGPYSILARPGDIAVVVLAGWWDTQDHRFIPLRMGVRRFVFTAFGEETTDVDIHVHTLLDRTPTLRFDRPPAGDSPGPNVMRIRPFLDFGSEGVFDLFTSPVIQIDHENGDVPVLHNAADTVPQGAEAYLFVNTAAYQGPIVESLELPGFPKLERDLDGVTITIETGLFTQYEGQTGLYAPAGFNYTRGLEDLSGDVVVTPFVGVADIESPAEGDIVQDVDIGWELVGGSTAPNTQLLQIVQPSLFGPIPVWRIFVDGETREVHLPDVRDINDFPDGGLQVYVIPIYMDGFDFDRFEYGDYATLLWRSYSVNGTFFQVQ